jgi:hypothetical protein
MEKPLLPPANYERLSVGAVKLKLQLKESKDKNCHIHIFVQFLKHYPVGKYNITFLDPQDNSVYLKEVEEICSCALKYEYL